MRSPRTARSQVTARRWFLVAAWSFAAYNVFGTIVSCLASLPASNGQHGNVHTVVSQAVRGNGTALSPPLFLVILWALFVVAATRTGWLGKAGAMLIWLSAAFYASAGQLGELTTTTSPLMGAKWTLVLILGALGIAIAAVVVLSGLLLAALEIVRSRSASVGPSPS